MFNNSTTSNFYYHQFLLPSVNVTVNRNRLKTYGSSVYLKDQSCYELEIFNPNTFKILAKIKIDGKLISNSGLVINPGERVYLERWLDSPNKFTFKTYEADNSPEGVAATANNGKIQIDFYSEAFVQSYSSIVTTNYPLYQTYFTTTGTLTSTKDFSPTTNLISNNSVSNAFNSTFETGISEKGEASSQTLKEDNTDFSSSSFFHSEITILPESKKPVEIKKIRSYCKSCGTRVRASSWVFCPSCGKNL